MCGAGGVTQDTTLNSRKEEPTTTTNYALPAGGHNRFPVMSNDTHSARGPRCLRGESLRVSIASL